MPTVINNFTIMGAIEEKWLASGGVAGKVGTPLSNEKRTFDGIGRSQRFTLGTISWHPKTGAYHVRGEIAKCWRDLGQEAFGYPITDEVATPDTKGRFNHFRALKADGSTIGESSIYWRPETGAHEIRGGIRERWLAQGAEGFGYPITNEITTPDGKGKFNHFRAFRPDNTLIGESSIYWTPEFGAKVLFGGIREKWAQLGWERSKLGFPKTDEMPFVEGGAVSLFEHGAIYWWADTGPIELNEIVVQYKGIICFGETDWDQGSDSDEPFVVFGVVTPNYSAAKITRVYSDVDGGESRSDVIELYRGLPTGIALNVQILEHDEDEPDRYRSAIEGITKTSLEALKQASEFIPVFGPVIKEAARAFIPLVAPATNLINEVFDFTNEWIGQATIGLSPKEMVIYATRISETNERGVTFKIPTPLISGDGASYGAYFTVFST